MIWSWYLISTSGIRHLSQYQDLTFPKNCGFLLFYWVKTSYWTPNHSIYPVNIIFSNAYTYIGNYKLSGLVHSNKLSHIANTIRIFWLLNLLYLSTCTRYAYPSSFSLIAERKLVASLSLLENSWICNSLFFQFYNWCYFQVQTFLVMPWDFGIVTTHGNRLSPSSCKAPFI